MPTTIALHRILSLCDPRSSWPWACEAPAPQALQELLGSAPEMATPVGAGGLAADHIGRIRFLARVGWRDAIEVDVGCPCLGYAGPSWPVTDGNHRLWAAALRGDETIDVDITGQVDWAAQLLGVAESEVLGSRTGEDAS